MSRLNPSLLVLDKGLDLQSAKLVAPEGTAFDMLNYEHVDFQGQKRIDGYVRYDGSVLSTIDDFYVSDDSGISVEEHPPYRIGFYNGKPFGIELEEGRYAVIDFTSLPPGTWGKEVVEDPDTHYNLLLEYNQFLRDKVEGLPGKVIGLHWFEDRLYAVVDIEDYNPDDSRIDTAGVASLFESRSIQQVLEEDGPAGPYDFGWRFVHQGWWVPFSNGMSLYGSLVAKNHNRSGVGVEGPTGISGTDGSPLALIQKVNLTNGPAQVNGWKSTSTRNSYLLNPNDVAAEDSAYTYADAFISWDAETGHIAVETSVLTEYSPTNSTAFSS